MWQEYFNCWSFYANISKYKHCPPNPPAGRVYPLSHGPNYSTPGIRRPVTQSSSYEYGFQEFQYFVVIDFEATCDEVKSLRPQEIIEFPAVIVNSRTGQLEDSFQTYVRPSHNLVLTEFCKNLTGIQQSQVDEGVPLDEALLLHDKWLEDKGVKHTNFAIVTWSNWDCEFMLESECRFKKINKPPYFNRWINLQIAFREAFSDGRLILKEAVKHAGLKWQGQAHCGLDDAKNTARLLAHLMIRGIKLSITDTLPGDPKQGASAMNDPQLIIRGSKLPITNTPAGFPKQGASAMNEIHPMIRGSRPSTTNTLPGHPKQAASAMSEPRLMTCGSKLSLANTPPGRPKQGVSAMNESHLMISGSKLPITKTPPGFPKQGASAMNEPQLMTCGSKLPITSTPPGFPKQGASAMNELHPMIHGSNLSIANTLPGRLKQGASAMNKPHLMIGGSKLPITNNTLGYPKQGVSAMDNVPKLSITDTAPRLPKQGTSLMYQPHQKCYCGAASKKHVLQLAAGQHKGGFFLGCGNYTPLGPMCNFLKWVPESDPAKLSRKL